MPPVEPADIVEHNMGDYSRLWAEQLACILATGIPVAIIAFVFSQRGLQRVCRCILLYLFYGIVGSVLILFPAHLNIWLFDLFSDNIAASARTVATKWARLFAFCAPTIGMFAGALVGSLVSVAPRWQKISLARALEQHGITRASLSHFRFVGDEETYTFGRAVVFSNTTWIWDTIFEAAERYPLGKSYGDRRVELYEHASKHPVAVLLVDATDATHIEGETRRFICHGLHEFAMKQLMNRA